MKDLQYPIGHHKPGDIFSEQKVHKQIEQIKALPSRLANNVEPLNGDQLDTPIDPVAGPYDSWCITLSTAT